MRSNLPLDTAPPSNLEHVRQEKIRQFESIELPPNLPDYILSDIVQVDPKASLWNFRAETDRRLRLLIRRYVNQIQFGCRNHNCTIPTCLSYRKRNTKRPLRRYTELSARTIACRLVDDFNSQGKDPALGLCQSEPLVPWYEDPDIAKRRRSTLDVRRKIGPLEAKQQQVQKNSAGLRRQQSVSNYIPINIHQDSSTLVAGAKIKSDTDSVTCEEEFVALEAKPADQNSNTGTKFTSEETNESLSLDTDTRAVRQDTSEPQHAAKAIHKKDFASFTQRVWDLLPLRRLGWVPDGETDLGHEEGRPHDSSELSIEAGHDQDLGCQKLSDEHHDLSLTKSTAFCGFALHRFSWRTIRWLVIRSDNPQTSPSTNFQDFLEQSVYYVLSNPKRLLDSVVDWSNGDPLEGSGPCIIRAKTRNFTSGADTARKNEIDESRKQNLETSVKPTSSNGNQTTDASRIVLAFSAIIQLQNKSKVFDALHCTLQKCYITDESHRAKPSQSLTNSTPEEKTSNKQDSTSSITARHRFDTNLALTDEQAVDCFFAILLAASTCLWVGSLSQVHLEKIHTIQLSTDRNGRSAYPAAVFGQGLDTYSDRGHCRWLRWRITTIDACEDWCLVRLLVSLMNSMSHRRAAQEVFRLNNRKSKREIKRITDMVVQKALTAAKIPEKFCDDVLLLLGHAILELSRTVLLQTWDREPVVKRTSPVGGALELLASLYRRRTEFELDGSLFISRFIEEAFDEMEMPSQWLSFRPDGRDVHLLSFSFLFDPATLVKYFRAINIDIMRKSHEAASIIFNDARQFLGSNYIPVYGGKEVLAEMRPSMARYFVLTIRRSSVLTDAINQIWRRQKQELMRPLRVRLGKDEGEDGLDHGGVQQEFFRLALAEAFQPEFGMFTVDERTRMTWFQPGSLEPLYKFEAIGILMSLAVYNGVTLPITFPNAFYRKLLQLKIKKLEHVSDGWPDLVKGLQFLLDWSDGDVADVIARTYEFSYEFAGSQVTIDMQKVGRSDTWPSTERRDKKSKDRLKSTSFELPVPVDITPPSHSPLRASPELTSSASRTSSIHGISTPISMESDTPDEATVVTNAIRDQYVRDYIFWLTDKSIEPQFNAFLKGFHTCLNPTALSIFTPEALKNVIEGHRDINIDELEQTATYEDFDRSSRTIIDFWDILRSFSPDQHRQLLEFVTASDRVPVNGIRSIQFIVQKNGEDDARLPSSSTCYGRLLLPQYSSKAILKEKLMKAIENSTGFGAL